MRYAVASLAGVVAAGLGVPALRPPFPARPGPERTPGLAALAREGYVRIPLVRGVYSGWYYVKVRIEGNPATLLLDTGAGDSAVDADRVTRLVPKLIKVLPTRSGDGVERGPIVFVETPLYPTLRIGPVRVPRLPCGTENMSRTATAFRADGLLRCDGLLGAPVLRYYSAVIDYRSDSLFLLDPVNQEAGLQGTWKGVELRHDGEVRRPGPGGGFGLVIDGPTVAATSGDKRSAYSLRLDLRADPKGMDWVGTKGGAIPLIYHLDGDRLTVAGTIFQDAAGTFTRPKGFDTPDGPGHTVAVFERVPVPRPGTTP